MRITLTSSTPGAKALLLGDDAQQWYILHYDDSLQCEVEFSRPLRAKFATPIQRDNAQVPVSFQVLRSHADAAAAVVHLLMHKTEVPRTGTLCVQESGASLYLTAVLRSLRKVNREGKSTTMAYEFACGLATTKPASLAED